MADLERFGGEVFLNVQKYISGGKLLVGVNDKIRTSSKQTKTVLEELGVTVDRSLRGAQMRDAAGRTTSVQKAVQQEIKKTIDFYDRLGRTGTAAEKALVAALDRATVAQKNFAIAQRRAVRDTQAAAKAKRSDQVAQDKARDSIDKAAKAGLKYRKSLSQVRQAETNLRKERNVTIATYRLLAGKVIPQTITQLKQLQAQGGGLRGFWTRLSTGARQMGGQLSAAGGFISSLVGKLGLLKLAGGAAMIGLATLKKGLGLIQKAFVALLSPISRAIQGLRNFFRIAAQIAVGVLIRDVIRGIVRELRDLVFAGFEAVKMFQQLELRLETLVSRLARAEDSTISVADAFEIGRVNSAKLIEFIKRLSLTAPFTTETIAKTLSLNLAMGFTEDMAKRLTLAIGEFTAGMGLGTEVMERIVFNFGQMKSAGKVTGTEMRDLARGAFFPLVDILDEAGRIMGVATDNMVEFRKQAAAGEVDVNTFFRAFLNVVDRDFAGSMERFSRTLEGVRTRFGNFMKTIIGLEVFGPVAKKVASIASAALDSILSPENIVRARLLGKVLLTSFVSVHGWIKQRLLPALSSLWRTLGFGTVTFESIALAVAKFSFHIIEIVKVVSGVIENITRQFTGAGETLASRMGKFGFNIIAQFARGMAAATVLVVRVLTWIGKAIASLLSPGSPPKLLPKLPQWGMEAMAEYLRGFTLADFDILEGIQDPIRDALDILEETGKIGENQAGKIFAQISKAIAKSLTTGGITDKVLNQIRKVAGPFGNEIVTLAKRQIELAKATEAVRIAEKRVEDARKAHEAARVKTNKLIREYNAQLRAGVDPSILKGRLAQINASEDAARAALEEEKASEADLERKEELLEVVERQLELQKRLVDQLLELTKAQIVQPEQPEVEAAGGAGEVPIEAIPELPPLPELDLPDPDELTAKMQEIFDKARAEVKEQWRLMREAWAETGLGQAFTNLAAQWRTTWKIITDFYEEKVQPIIDRIVKWWTETGLPELSESFGKMGKVLSEVWETIGEVIEGIGEQLEEAGLEGVSISLEQVLNVIKDIIIAIAGAITIVLAIIDGLITGIIAGVMTASTVIRQAWELVLEGVDTIREAWQLFQDGLLTFPQLVGGILTGLFQIIMGVIETALGAIIGFIAGFIDGVVEYFRELWRKLVGGSIVPDMMDDIYNGIVGPLEELKEVWDGIWQSLTDWWEDTLKPAIDDVDQWIDDLVADIISNYENLRDRALEKWRKFFSETLPEAGDTLRTKFNELMAWLQTNVRDPIVNFIEGEIEDLRAAFAETLTNAIETFRTNVLDPLSIGFTNIKDAASRLWDKIIEVKNALLAFPFNLLKMLSGGSPSPLSIGIDFAAKSMEKMARKSLPELAKSFSSLQGGVSSPVTTAPSVVGGSTQSLMVQMGGVNITNGMDDAMFEQRVINIVKKGLRG
jgi:tape measure domain-containing protein